MKTQKAERLFSRNKWTQSIAMLALAIATTSVTSAAQAASFWTSGKNFIRDGASFTPKGINMNGANWVWNDETTQNADAADNGWRFNTIRLNCFMNGGSGRYTVNNDLDRIINTYTSRGFVVMLEVHDFTGWYPSDSDLANLRAWWVDKANRYKNNSHVWFNLINEPGGETNNTTSSRWLTIHENLIQAVRNTGANNVIICDGSSWGQDQANWQTGYNPNSSAILTYGPTLKSKYSNIGFAVHLYEQWGQGTQADANNKLAGYLDAVNARGLPLLIGEAGGYADSNTAPSNTNSGAYFKATNAAFNVAPSRGVGILMWHGQPGDGYSMVSGPNGTIRYINSYSNPTNLTWQGQLLWNYTHGGTTPPPPPPPPSSNLASNPGFEAEQYGTQTPSGWSEWSGWGTTGAGYSESGGRSSSFRGAHWASYGYQIATFQTKTGLANGNYTLRAWVKGSGGQTKAVLYAKNYGGTERNITIPATNSWTQISITNINITNGQCELGFFSEAAANRWINFDDVEFFKQ